MIFKIKTIHYDFKARKLSLKKGVNLLKDLYKGAIFIGQLTTEASLGVGQTRKEKGIEKSGEGAFCAVYSKIQSNQLQQDGGLGKKSLDGWD